LDCDDYHNQEMATTRFSLPEVRGELENTILHFGNASEDCQYKDLCVLSQGQVADICALLSLVYGTPMNPPSTIYDIYNARKCIEAAHYDLVLSVYTAYVYQLMRDKRAIQPTQFAIFFNWAKKLDDDIKRVPMREDVKQRIQRIQQVLRRRPPPPQPLSDGILLPVIKPIDIRALPRTDGAGDRMAVIGALRKFVHPEVPVDTPVLFFYTQFITLSYLFARYAPNGYATPINDFIDLRRAMLKADKREDGNGQTVADLLFEAYYHLYNPAAQGSGPAMRVLPGCPERVRKLLLSEMNYAGQKANGDDDSYEKRVSTELLNIEYVLGGRNDMEVDLALLVEAVQKGDHKARGYLEALSLLGFPHDPRVAFVFKAIAAQFMDDFNGTSRSFMKKFLNLNDTQQAIVLDALVVFLISGHRVLSRKAAKWALPYLNAARAQASEIRKRNLISLQDLANKPRAFIIGEVQSAFKTAESDLEFAIGKLRDRVLGDNGSDDANNWGVP
jgi:hypothetical protein